MLYHWAPATQARAVRRGLCEDSPDAPTTWEALAVKHKARAQKLIRKALANNGLGGRRCEPQSARGPRPSPLPASVGPPCLELVEDEGMHERWSAVLKGRLAEEVPEAELRWLVDTGMPLRHRHRLWPRWWGRRPVDMKVEALQSGIDDQCERQIECDLDRTLPERLVGADRRTLRRVLRACAAWRPEVGYCQGMSFLAAVPILLGFPEEAAFACLCYVTEEICPGYHGPCLEGYFRDVAILHVLLRRLLPEIHEKLEALEMPLHMLATDHFLTLSTRIWPLAAVIRLWDVVLMDGSAALLASFLATMNMYFLDAAAIATQDGRGHTQPADVACRFRGLSCLGVARDVDEIVHQTRKFLPLVQGEVAQSGGRGNVLEWFRAEVDSGSTKGEADVA